MSGYIDGSYANAFLTDNTVSYPLNVPNNSGTRLYSLTYVQAAANYADATLGSTSNDAPNAYLVEQSPATRIGAEMVEFQRTYAEIPVTWTEAQQIVYTYPGLSSGTGFSYQRYGSRRPTTVPKLATVTHEYVLSNSVPTANIAAVTIVTLNGQPVDWIGQASAQDNTNTVPNADPSTWTVASDPRLWRGTIWEIVTQTVTGPNTFV
jgi:hypothetical protein